MNYYSIWDTDGAVTGQIGLVPHKTSLASTVSTSVTPLPLRIFTLPTSAGITEWGTAVLTVELAAGIVGIVGVATLTYVVVYALLYEIGMIALPSIEDEFL